MLRWSSGLGQYRCGALGVVGLGEGSPVQNHHGLLGRSQARFRTYFVARWIAAGSGCDCALEPLVSPTMETRADKDRDGHHD